MVDEYTPEQARVAKYIGEATNQAIGGGDDPVGFLIASHATLRMQLEQVQKPNQKFLRHLVDVVCGEAWENQSVPATEWADRMIDYAYSGEKGPMPKKGKPTPAERTEKELDPHGECDHEIKRLKMALGPFAFLGSVLTGKEKDESIFVGQRTPDGTHHPVTFGDLRRAAKIIYG